MVGGVGAFLPMPWQVEATWNELRQDVAKKEAPEGAAGQSKRDYKPVAGISYGLLCRPVSKSAPTEDRNRVRVDMLACSFNTVYHFKDSEDLKSPPSPSECTYLYSREDHQLLSF